MCNDERKRADQRRLFAEAGTAHGNASTIPRQNLIGNALLQQFDHHFIRLFIRVLIQIDQLGVEYVDQVYQRAG